MTLSDLQGRCKPFQRDFSSIYAAVDYISAAIERRAVLLR